MACADDTLRWRSTMVRLYSMSTAISSAVSSCGTGEGAGHVDGSVVGVENAEEGANNAALAGRAAHKVVDDAEEDDGGDADGADARVIAAQEDVSRHDGRGWGEEGTGAETAKAHRG
eukprot:TRINITY_DN2862_c0_g1_i8.p2 TRINITY_DN2862_c0_g1~~TRINITY_DN2862_c0_g1_i8.p2  ORF type:complete len:117 (-),score=17.80 TRINITY_DN2862_c0_g1_i8:3-353(-)